ncbi:triose-phosphate isomerase [Weissella diestrammenae]|uniref:Triosephosphate isomerase n=1 Tax=Weissella diestrammenae TaxID=1162633 RepID=A0A7G9T6A6_9LACO|nr:triose-phosphate isomerase [Weissella diestrammenae]MCM0583323.1 triose-phosphate isomerase [Weissella diestrammenae]QNN75631.1 triose-phosphate isomerase [Weissella diestrammenae]
MEMMKRRPLVVANWKMNKLPSESSAYIKHIEKELIRYPDVISVLAGQDVLLPAMLKAAKETSVAIGAENMYWQEKGAFTGETSPAALEDLGVTYVIIGHSERRNYFRETNEMVNLKAIAAIAHRLIPIIAIDEPIVQGDDNDRSHWVVNQVIESLEGISAQQAQHVILAYEPTAAIGSGQPITPELAEFSLRRIRLTLADMYDWPTANAIRIMYGGSVKPNNALELMRQPDIDGVLVGDAALNPDTFLELCRLANEALLEKISQLDEI